MNRSRTLAIGLVVILTATILLFPNVLKETEKSIEKTSPLDEKVQVAVKMIESGNGNPMEAIFSLREVVETDSNIMDNGHRARIANPVTNTPSELYQ